ncbi:hypothetical protein SEA_BLAB_3 [Microbacterium phage Blab]|nr:hypothetical protein SEA_BLAB_3 [Microbacterium phage Blab]
MHRDPHAQRLEAAMSDGMVLRPGGDEWDQVMFDAGYTWCQPCGEHHRPPQCALRPDGSIAHPWESR